MHNDTPNLNPRPRFVRLELTEDEFAVMNWLRFKHRPAKLPFWAMDTLRAAALDQARARISASGDVPQGIAEALTRLREKSRN